MSNRLIKIIIGAVLTLSVGFLVFATKKPVFVPNETRLVETVTSEEKQNIATERECFFVKNKFYDDDDDDRRNIITATSSIVNNPTQQDINLSQIAQHNSRSSCWLAINGGVYNLTSWIPNHPGGEKTILSMCGTDGSAGYNGQHGGRAKITAILGGFKIGILAK